MNSNRTLPSDDTMEALGFADLDGLVTVSWSNAPHPNDSSEAYVARQACTGWAAWKPRA